MKSKFTVKMNLIVAGILLTFGTITNIGCGTAASEKTATTERPATALLTDTAKAEQRDLKNDSTIKVYVYASGKITANGNPTNLTMLDSAFSRLKNSGKKVCYSRDNIEGNPPEESMQVIELVVKYGLSLQFYTDKTFTKVAEIH